MSDRVFKVFPSCFLVAGFSRSLIIDGQRWKFHTIPNTMYELLKTYDGCSINEVKQNIAKTEAENNILEKYFEFLFDNEIIFECNRSVAKQFTPVKTTFENPSKITNAIIEINDIDLIKLENILIQLTQLACYNLELRIKIPTNTIGLIELFQVCHNYEIENLSVIAQSASTIDELEIIFNDYPFIVNFINYNQEFDFVHPLGFSYSKKNLSNNNCCGIIKEEYFIPTMQHFLESMNYNTCLNRKVSIDIDGNIKNCPSMHESFGNISSGNLKDIINKPDFKKKWNIRKDDINKCKDCEFRHICTDCRAYVDDPSDILAAPLKCGYNPYSCEWEEWSTHPLKQQAIANYNFGTIL